MDRDFPESLFSILGGVSGAGRMSCPIWVFFACLKPGTMPVDLFAGKADPVRTKHYLVSDPASARQRQKHYLLSQSAWHFTKHGSGRFVMETRKDQSRGHIQRGY